MNTSKTIDIEREDILDNDAYEMQTVRTESQNYTKLSTTGVLRNILYFMYSLLATLLALRLVLTLLIANKQNTFADIIYTLSNPFVAPFRSLFNINTTIGSSGSRFEIETAAAIVVYGLFAYVVARLLYVNSTTKEDY